MIRFECQLTDTFSGEANYGWVRRATIDVPDNASDATIVRRAKAALGITGVRCRRSNYGDTIQLDIVGACMVAFIDFDERLIDSAQ